MTVDPVLIRQGIAMRGCLFSFIAVGTLVAAWLAYVEVPDALALRAAKSLCTPENVLQVRQGRVWQHYLRQLPATEPYGRFLDERRRVRASLGIRDTEIRSDENLVLILSNDRGEIARITWMWARSAAFSYDAPPFQIFSCADKLPELYSQYGGAF